MIEITVLGERVEVLVQIGDLRRDGILELDVDVESARSLERFIQLLRMVGRREQDRVFL